MRTPPKVMTINRVLTFGNHTFLPGATVHVIIEREFKNGDTQVMTSFGLPLRIPAEAATFTEGLN